MRRRNLAGLMSTVATAVLMVSGFAQAQAQTAPVTIPTQQDDDQTVTGLDEIVVTAQKREERLQDVPIAVSAFGEQALEAANISNATELSRAVPTLSLTTSASGVQPFLRGIGNPSTTPGNEASTALYVDGVYYPRLPNSVFGLNNVARVEVLKGPQGTLFGRNAVGGLIQIITKTPSFTPTLELRAGYGNYETATGSFYGSTGLTDKIAVDLAVSGTHQGEGWGRNVVSGDDVGYENSFAARSKALVLIDDLTTFTLSANYQRTTTTVGFPIGTYRGTIQAAPSAPNTPLFPLGFYDARNNGGNVGKSENYGVSARLEHEFSFASFVSLTAWHHADEYNTFDFDYTSDPFFLLEFSVENRLFSQEFQLNSLSDSPIQWTAGLYYSNIRADSNPARQSGTLFGTSAPTSFAYQISESYAAFGQATLPLGEATSLTLGLRYSNDSLESTGHNDTQTAGGYIVGPTLPLKSTSYDRLNYKIVLDHHFSEDVLAYVSYSTGYKAGNYNLSAANAAPPLDPEEIKALEVGLKSEWLDNRLRLNLAAYNYEIEKPQVQIRNGALFVPINAGASEARGFEVEGQAVLATGLNLRFSAGLQKSEYTDFPNAPIVTARTVTPPYGNTAFTTFDAKGFDVTRAPRFTGSIGLDYAFETSVGRFTAVANYAYNDGFYWTVDHQISQDSYGLVDAQLSYQLPNNDAWKFRAWAKNLTDTEYYSYATEGAGISGFAGAPAAPRTFGIAAEYQF